MTSYPVCVEAFFHSLTRHTGGLIITEKGYIFYAVKSWAQHLLPRQALSPKNVRAGLSPSTFDSSWGKIFEAGQKIAFQF